jgi:transcriptional regulator with XRE-family HTH domain
VKTNTDRAASEAPEDDRIEVGRRLRRAREDRRLTTRELAARSGRSPGFISQVETGRTGMSVASLRRIAAALGIAGSELLSDDEGRRTEVRRADDRPEFVSDSGLVKLLVSGTPVRRLEVYEGTLDVGGSTGDDPYAHDDAAELLYVLEGHVRVLLDGDVHLLGPRDSIEYHSSSPHRVDNVGADKAVVMWILSHATPPDEEPAHMITPLERTHE